MGNKELGRLESIAPRDVWASESSDFTPWLALEENLRLLGEAIGLQLELKSQEAEVGPFRADILCRDVSTDGWVLIENQLERTDHTHLGQLLTYAAGLKAVTIVWIANPFTDEHRAALDWLNEITDSRFNFFGLEVELWRIGDSIPAPKFNIVSKPNDWSKTVLAVTAHGDLSKNRQLQLAFWTAFTEFLQGKETTVSPTKPGPQNWMSMGIGRSGFTLTAIASMWNSEEESWSSQEIRVELAITGEQARQFFDQLMMQRHAVEEDAGYELAWHNPPESQSAKIYVRKNCMLLDREEWPGLHEWLQKRLEDFKRVFAARVRSLDVQAADSMSEM